MCAFYKKSPLGSTRPSHLPKHPRHILKMWQTSDHTCFPFPPALEYLRVSTRCATRCTHVLCGFPPDVSPRSKMKASFSLFNYEHLVEPAQYVPTSGEMSGKRLVEKRNYFTAGGEGLDCETKAITHWRVHALIPLRPNMHMYSVYPSRASASNSSPAQRTRTEQHSRTEQNRTDQNITEQSGTKQEAEQNGSPKDCRQGGPLLSVASPARTARPHL